ncbi:MAG: hypothetical protein EOP84_28930 [Verrucomicrobiaceae bacterium]|nr:MAG: hypothetical protein EOP84_28930 [Verrucomicrobiaceae bacterium]
MGPNFYLNKGFASEGQEKNVVYSLRDQFYQENTVNRNLPNGQADPNASFLPVPAAVGQSKETASDAQWLELLKQSTTGLSLSAPVLRLRFATSFDPRGNNPLYTELADQFGHVILSSSGGGRRKGIFVNIKGRGLPARSYSVKLEQSGVTYLPFKPRNDNGWRELGFPVRVWSLPPRSGSLTAVLNKDDDPGNPSSAFYDVSVPAFTQFDERSPYADQWELTVDGAIPGSPNWRLLSEDLAKITDIRVGLTVQGFDPQKVQ